MEGMSSEIVCCFDTLEENFSVCHKHGGIFIISLISRGDTTESFELRRTAVEKFMAKMELQHHKVLTEFVTMDSEQYVLAHEILTGNLVLREKAVGIDDIRRIATGVCRAVRGVMAFLNNPARDGITMLSNDKGIVRMEKLRIKFSVDEILDAIQRDFTRREGQSEDLIIVFLGFIMEDNKEYEDNDSEQKKHQ